MSEQLSASRKAELTERALKYFKEKGIDVRVKPTKENTSEYSAALQEKYTFKKNDKSVGMEVDACGMEILSLLFYTYLVFDAPGVGSFEGHSGGLGVGELTCIGVLYYENLTKLTSTHDFGVFFGADYGGFVQVTWGSNGNATALGIGAGLGAFGGRGNWS